MTEPFSPGSAGPSPYETLVSRPSTSPARNRTLLTGAAAGVVLMLVIGAVLALAGLLQVGDAGGHVSRAPVDMPDTLGGYDTLADVSAARGASGDQLAANRRRWERTAALTVEAYSAAFGGAGVGVRTYADEELEFLPTVIAIRAPAPGLTTGVVSDPADLGLAVSQSEVRTDGEVQCIVVHTVPAAAGSTPDPDDVVTTLCLRTENAFSVFVSGGSGASGESGRTSMVELTDAAYEALSS